MSEAQQCIATNWVNRRQCRRKTLNEDGYCGTHRCGQLIYDNERYLVCVLAPKHDGEHAAETTPARTQP